MSTKHTKHILPLLASALVLAGVSGAAVAQAAPVASKFVLSSYFGWKVNQTTGGTVCTVASGDKCTEFELESGRGVFEAEPSSEPGGFETPQSVAVDNYSAGSDYGDVYVADSYNNRVQVLTPAGVFVSMFGWEVNRTKVEEAEKGASVTQAEKNVCTAASKDVCKAGVRGDAPGQMNGPFSIASDAASGDVYIAEKNEGGGFRVQEFTAAGTWVLELGKEVNATTKGNVCTAQEVETKGRQCAAPAPTSSGSSEHGAFNLYTGGNVLAVGGPEDLLYVGDENRVQEFKADGEWKGEISLTSISAEPKSDVVALAVDETGDVYLAYGLGVRAPEGEGGGPETGSTNVVREFNPSGAQTSTFEVSSREPNPISLNINGLALDPYGRLGVLAEEVIPSTNTSRREEYGEGALYTASGVKISEFGPSSGKMVDIPTGLVFSASSDALYVASKSAVGVVTMYSPAVFPEPVTCAASEVTATSATLCGELNPNGSKARGFFAYSPPAGSRTPVAFEGEGTVLEPVTWHLDGLEPNQTYEYGMVAEAEVAGKQETREGARLSFHTPTPAPEIPGAPQTTGLRAQSAVLQGVVDPEHALAHYHFEYARCAREGQSFAQCGTAQAAPVLESSQPAAVGVAQEVGGLTPGTPYVFRLVADNAFEREGAPEGGQSVGEEGHFLTPALASPSAQTGGVSAVGVTSALVSGTVDPDGQSATYVFELGVYAGSATQYGVVASGSAGSAAGPVGEVFALAGLQPGTTYAVRIVIRSAYAGPAGEQAGEAVLFTTQGVPAELTAPSSLPLLAVPAIAFPTQTTGATSVKQTARTCKRGKKRSRRKCVAAKVKRKKAKRTSRSRNANRRP